MSKILPKVQYYAIAFVAGATIYFISIPGVDRINNNLAFANQNPHQGTIISVWDRETEPDYSGTTEMTVYRSPSCGCCGVWLEHAQKHGFQIKDIKTEEMEALKQKYNIPSQLTSCHTAIIDGYVMEGHIPADDIKRFLTEKPDAIGLTVPGMIVGTPGMETKNIKQPFQVLAFNRKGEVEVFKEYQFY